MGSCPFRILPGQKERFESGQGARDAGGGGSGAKEAVNETGAQKGAGKGGKGQRAAEESEKGKKLRESGRGRRSRTARGPRKDRKAGRGEREVPRQGQAAAAEGARRGPGPAQAVSAGARRNQRRAGPEEATRGPVGPGGRNAVSRPLPVPSGLSPPRSWGAPAIHSPVLIDSPRTQRLTDPDPNPRRGGGARTPPESHCACVTRSGAPPPVHAPPTRVTRQRGRRRLRRCRGWPRLSNAPYQPLSEARAPNVTSCYSLRSLLDPQWVRW